MSTGVYPATHGLALNAWWDRASGREMACTDDGGAKAIGHRAGPKAPTGGHSAHLLRAPTLADVLRQQLTPTPRVVSMSMKPRAAIMLAGHGGDAVLWYTPEGGPTTSTAYAGSPIPFAQQVRAAEPEAVRADRRVEEAAARRRLPERGRRPRRAPARGMDQHVPASVDADAHRRPGDELLAEHAGRRRLPRAPRAWPRSTS